VKNIIFDMGVSKNRGVPKWMVYIMENPIEMDDLDFLKHPYDVRRLPKFQDPPKSTNGKVG